MASFKQGIDYFPFQVELDNKFKFIKIKFGFEGFGIAISLLQHVYSIGYWCEWSEDDVAIFADEKRIEVDLLNNIIEESLKRGLFNQELYDQYEILTSKGIQKRYKEIVRRRKDVEITKEYLLINGDWGKVDGIVTTFGQHPDNKIEQKKGEEKKGEEKKLIEPEESDIVEEIIEDDIPEFDIKKDYAAALKLNKAFDINKHFEDLWKLYPVKKGKDKVLESDKKELFKYSFDDLEKAIDNIMFDYPDHKYIMHGRRFFKGEFVDYLPGKHVRIQKSEPVANKKNNDFHNFKQHDSDYSNDEIETKLKTKASKVEVDLIAPAQVVVEEEKKESVSEMLKRIAAERKGEKVNENRL